MGPILDGALAEPSDYEFRLFQELVLREAGISLAPFKRTLLAGRVRRRMVELGIESYEQYFHAVRRSPTEELHHLLDLITTNETQFFREPWHFDFIARQAVPGWIEAARRGVRSRQIKVWSAACSSGEEPYSLAMLLLELLPPGSGWHIEILGSDLSNRMLARADAGIYPIERISAVSPARLERFMLRGLGRQDGKVRVSPLLRSVVRFQRINLNDVSYPVSGPFDLILCRNVLIYFDANGRDRVTGRLFRHLTPDGYLILGHAETLPANPDRHRAVGPTVYGLARRPTTQ